MSSSSPTSTAFLGLDDELRDARRVLSHGQEEDLRCALDRVLNRVEELSLVLKTALRTQTDLETQLNLAKSNLQLVISNNEMLEEALKREQPCSARDLGWRRWSAREAQNHNTAEDRPRSLDYGSLNESGTPNVPSSAAVVLVNGTKPTTPWTPSAPPATPMTSQESRFFKFRFSSAAAAARSPALSPHPSHLTSPSLSSLVPNAREREIEELQEQLERERQAHKAAETSKAALEAELESLSQALFEEANKMVAVERMKRAETEEELNQARLEKDALRQALKLVEGENGRLRSATSSHETPQETTDTAPKSPPPQPPAEPPIGNVTLPDVPIHGHSSSFVLEPAPKPSLAGLHRRTASMEKAGRVDISVEVLKGSLPSIAASPSVPLMPEEPSPWADVAS